MDNIIFYLCERSSFSLSGSRKTGARAEVSFHPKRTNMTMTKENRSQARKASDPLGV